jgi:hypothetical protein
MQVQLNLLIEDAAPGVDSMATLAELTRLFSPGGALRQLTNTLSVIGVEILEEATMVVGGDPESEYVPPPAPATGTLGAGAAIDGTPEGDAAHTEPGVGGNQHRGTFTTPAS